MGCCVNAVVKCSINPIEGYDEALRHVSAVVVFLQCFLSYNDDHNTHKKKKKEFHLHFHVGLGKCCCDFSVECFFVVYGSERASECLFQAR